MSDDVEYHRSPWEAIDEHWRARIQFIEEHKATHGADKALTLSHVWYNVYYHGAQYPPDVQQLVSRWEPNLDDLPLIREKKEIFGASSSATANARTPLVSTDCDVKPLITEVNLPDTHISESIDCDVKPLITEADLPYVHISEISPELLTLSRKLIIEEMSSIREPVTSIYNCAQKLKISIKFDEIRDHARRGDSQVLLTAVLDGVRIASAAGVNRKAAKYEAALAALKLLIALQRQQGIEQKPRWKPDVNEEEAVGRNALVHGKQMDERLPDTNVGSQLLMKMGWSGSGGLGRGENKGIEMPVILTGNLGREGLGAKSGETAIDRQRVEHELRQFVVNSDVRELTFSSDLTQEDRRIVHEMAQRLHLKHRSFDILGRRHLVLSKETTASEIEARKDLLRTELGVDWNDRQTHRQTDRLYRKHGREEYSDSMNNYSNSNAKMSRFDSHHTHAGQYGYNDRRWDDQRRYGNYDNKGSYGNHDDDRRYGNYDNDRRYGNYDDERRGNHGGGYAAWQGRR